MFARLGADLQPACYTGRPRLADRRELSSAWSMGRAVIEFIGLQRRMDAPQIPILPNE